jgi:hypothetical protein
VTAEAYSEIMLAEDFWRFSDVDLDIVLVKPTTPPRLKS